MARKSRSKPSRPSKTGFNPETSRWLVPIVFVCFLLALVVLFSDFIFSDQMLYGSDTLQQGYMFRSFLIDYFHDYGSVPQWIPYYFGGMPYVEAFHGDIFYPLTLLKYVMPLKRSLGWHLFLHIFLSGLFMFFCARQFKLGKVPALMSAAGYMYAAYLISMVAPGHDGKTYVTALFPLVILFLDRGFEKKPLLNFTLMGVAIGLGLLAPHAAMAYFTLWGACLYTIFKLVMLYLDRRSLAPLIKPGGFALYAVVVGLALSAIQFYPGYVYTTEFSPRSDAKRGWDWATSWSMHEEEAMNLIIPEFSGTNSHQGAETYYWGKNAFKDNAESVGVVTFFVALLGFLFVRRREKWFFLGLAVVTLFYALGATTPVFRLFYWLVPKVDTLRAPSMSMFMFSFSAALLAGMALQRIIDSRSDRSVKLSPKFKYWLLGYPAFLGLLAVLFSIAGEAMLGLWSSLFYSEASTTLVQQNFTKLDVAYMNLPAIQSGAWIAFFVAALAAGCIGLYLNHKAGSAILLGVVALVVVDGVRFDLRFISLVDEGRFRQQYESNPLATYFNSLPGDFRVHDMARVNDNTLPHFGVDVLVGYHGNQLRWYDDLLGGMALTNVLRYNPRLFNLAGVKYLIHSPQARFPGDQNWFGPRPLSVVRNLGQINILENDNAFPRVFLCDAYRVEPDRKRIVDEIINGSSDLRAAVLLEEQPELTIPLDTLGSDSAWFIDHGIDTVSIGVSVTSNKLLVLTDNYYNAWQVTVDGSPAKLHRAYGSFRAVEVPAGSQRVEMIFDSPRYDSASVVTYCTAGYVLLVIAGSMVMDRCRRAADDTEQNADEDTDEEEETTS